MVETVDDLFEKIKKQKEKLIEDKIIAREKPQEKISDDSYKFSDWKLIRLGDYCSKITDYVASGSFASLKENVKITNVEDYAIMVKTADFSNDFSKNLTYTDKHGYDFLKNSNLFGGELILSNIGSIGKVFKVPHLNKPMTLASNTIMLRFTDDELVDYIYYYFKSNAGYDNLMSISSGSTMKKFNKTDLKTLVIPIAPLEQQRKITEELNNISECISNLEKQKEETKKLSREIFTKMFQEISGETKKLGEILSYEQPTKYIVENDNYDDNNNIPVLTAGKTFILGYTDEETGVFKGSQEPVIIFDDFTTSSHYVNFDFKVKSSAMKILHCNSGYDIRFMEFLLKNINIDTSVHKRYWISEFANIEVKIPSKEDQQIFKNRAEEIDNLIQLIDEQITDLESLLEAKLNYYFE